MRVQCIFNNKFRSTTFQFLKIIPNATTGGAGLIIVAEDQLQAQIFLRGNANRGGGSVVFAESDSGSELSLVTGVLSGSANQEQLQLIGYY